MTSETLAPASDTPPPTPDRRRLQFSIRSLLLFTLFAALVLTSLLMYLRLSEAELELVKLRQEAGYLKVEDESLFHAVAMPCDEPLTWKWRVFLPKGSKYRWTLASGDAIPQSGMPKGQLCSSSYDELSPRSKGVEVVITAVIRKDPAPENKRWIFHVSRRWVADDSKSVSETSIPDDLMWKIIKSRCPDTSQIGHHTQEIRKPGETIELLKERIGERTSPHSWITSPNPQPGFGVWLEEIK